ncbi:YolD-like family protein [Bacillus sp. JJ1532]|uniref:YolD-like family protein n=1 Tax=Bacillus sp. JJ1532 TaxID=3122958 RepID=UPI002FFF12B6
MMIRDRGLIKWQPAHFMPEHRKMLRNLANDENRQNMPQLDEQELEEIGILVMDSLNYAIPIKVTIWNHGYYIHRFGVVSKVDQFMKHILLENETNNERIMISDITCVERI